MFDVRLGGVCGDMCYLREFLPIEKSPDGSSITVVMKKLTSDTERLLSYLLEANVDAVKLPKNLEVETTFDNVINLCIQFYATLREPVDVLIVANGREDSRCWGLFEMTTEQHGLKCNIEYQYQNFLSLHSKFWMMYSAVSGISFPVGRAVSG